MICLENKTPQHVAMHFENQWLISYPHHIGVIHDPSTEFISFSFQSMLNVNGIQVVPTTTKNPQANATVCEMDTQHRCGHVMHHYLFKATRDVAKVYAIVETSALASAQ
jgi:hypothetical protein